MNALWFYLTVLCLTLKKCSAEVLPTDDVANVRSNTTIQYPPGNERVTSCLQAHSHADPLGSLEITLPGLDPFRVQCDDQIAGDGYTVIASRSNVKLNFFRNWTEYKRGFGDFSRTWNYHMPEEEQGLSNDFFIGLDKLHAITKSQTYELYVHLEDFDGNTRFARYDEFYIENENELYKLSTLGNYKGDAGDSLSLHKGMKFSTYDKDNDIHNTANCALDRLGAWWYHNCTCSNLFGMYFDHTSPSYESGMVWYDFRGPNYSYKTMKMLVRPVYGCSRSKK